MGKTTGGKDTRKRGFRGGRYWCRVCKVAIYNTTACWYFYHSQV
ncbi:hypothetical protein FOXYSP1_20655 [Fusarium oxysporum f. sp. phaseoli]